MAVKLSLLMNNCYFPICPLQGRKSEKRKKEQKARFHFRIKTNGKGQSQAINSKSGLIIRNKKNGGFAEGNNLCIKKVLEDDFDYIVLFNMDTEVDKSCVSVIESN